MSNHKLSGLRPHALAIAVTLCCIAPVAMAAGRQDLQNANLRAANLVLANLSGRGDKDVHTIAAREGIEL